MANILRYTFQVPGEDSSPITFDDVADAQSIVDYGGWDFTGLSPVYSLEDTNTTFVITITFPNTAEGRTAQDAFHNNVKDEESWAVTANSPYTFSELNYMVSNQFKVTSIKDGEVDLI